MYTVIGGVSSRAFRVLWALEEIGAPYEMVPAKPRTEEVRALNPSGKIPVLRDGEAVLTDSTAIMTYLADKHGTLAAPAGTVARARQDALTQAILDELDALLWTAARHSFILPEEMRVPAIKEPLKREYAANLDRIAARIEGPCAMGEAFTIPDILLTHCCNWAISARFPDPPEPLKEYLAAMRGRAAFARVRALGKSA